MAPSTVKHTNRLIHESSPYLLQHAHNPVDWYPWGTEAFEAARRENKPIFLSVGYSTCYWCHVMERQCFENEQIAAEMNQRFINIKVDREERPDVDQVYMTAVQVLARQGGWPMSVFLTPDLRPFYGGTYFPPTDMYGRPGFLTLLRAIDGAYHERPQDVQNTCIQLVDILQQLAEPQPPETPVTINRELIHELVQRSTADFDAKQGGFGGAPKFPRQTLLEMLLVYLREMSPAQRKESISRMLRRTLDAMADGGIRDQLGGGFHRYSTDAQWLVPHFEIMLYDNAMLAWVYAEASHQLQEPRYAAVAHGILDFILREMTGPEGGFYTAFDAEVDAMEGQTYLWSREEILAMLGPENGNLFCHVYGVDLGPNFADPHHGAGTPDRNILYLPTPLAEVAAEMGLSADQLEQKLQPMRQALLSARKKRKQPLLDTKILTSWNALAIRALAHAGRVLDEPKYTAAANRAADYLLQKHLKPDGRLCRSRRDDVVKHDGFLDDYAFLIQALLELHSSDPQGSRRKQAASLAQRMVDLFADKDGSGLYFTAEDAKDLIVRQKVAADSPLPSGNAVAAIVLLALDHAVVSRDILTAFAGQLEKNPDSMSSMLEAAVLYLRRNDPIAISTGPWRPDVDRPLSPEKLAEMVVESSAAWIEPSELHIRCAISSQYHINSHQPRPGLVSTQLAVGGEAAELVEAIEYPPGEERRFAFAPDPLHVYQDTILIVVRFKRPMAGSPPLHLALSYQACTEDACLPPVTRTFEVSAP